MIELTQKEYEKQRKKGLRTNEGFIYRNPKDKKKIIKVIEPKADSKEYLEIKKYTIKLLLENASFLEGLKIAIPKEGINIDGVLRGYTSNNIKGKNLYFILNDPTISFDVKLSCIKQIGQILRDMESIRNRYSHLSNLFYNDIHENNFIVTNNIEVIGIDFDSCSIQDNIPIEGLYPTILSEVDYRNHKYQKCNQQSEHATRYIPDNNLDLYSYIMIILNFMYGIPMYGFSPQKLDKYLNYLESKGANLELLYALSYIYDDSVDNINPDYLLDYIKEIYQYSCIKLDETGNLRRVLR